VLSNEVYLNRIEELENALERLLECFDTSISQFADGDGGTRNRPWIEVEVEESDISEPIGTVIVEGQVNQTTADAVEFALEVLYQEVEEWGGIEE